MMTHLLAWPRHRCGILGTTLAVLGCVGLSLTSLAAAAPAAPDAAAIMAKADRMNSPRYEVIRMRMELLSNDGRPLARELDWHVVNNDGTRTALFKFTEPASLRGVGTLVIETEGKPNSIWHYTPETRNVRRIGGAHRQNKFMGTEFVFEDFEGLKLDRYAFTLLRTEICGEASQCYVIEGRPSSEAEKQDSGYGRKVFWIDQKSYAIVKINLHDHAGTLVKTFESTGFREKAGYWRPMRQLMTNVANGRTTALVELQRSVDEPFDPHLVSQQYLRSE
jgi:hypothetical protein